MEQSPWPNLSQRHEWHPVSHPLVPDADLPPANKVVLVWIEGAYLPFCGYLKFAAGDRLSPYFVVYHGNPERGSKVLAWSDCLPDEGPSFLPKSLTDLYQRAQQTAYAIDSISIGGKRIQPIDAADITEDTRPIP